MPLTPSSTLRALALSLFASALFAPACGGGSPSEPDPTPVVRPGDPAQNDATFQVAGAPAYLLAGDPLTPSTKSFTVRVTPSGGATEIDLWLDDGDVMPLRKEGADFVVDVDATDLAIGPHGFMLAERGAEKGFYKANFVKGHALYVIISTDWDFSDVDDRVLNHHEELHVAHPELKITHLIGPYTFTDPAVSQARRDYIVGWAKAMRDTYGDEIGLHIHPYCNFIESAGVACKTTPSVSMPTGDPTGYTVRLGAYSRDEWNTLFAKADELWQGVGFGKPTSFRAGAWTLETHVAQALADSGFVVDSSANNWKYMEEWIGYDIYEFNKQQWAVIDDTSQPYRPTEDSIVPGGSGAEIALLEVPDNGIMVDYWTVEEMKGIFDANWSGAALETPTQVSTGFHPATPQYYSSYEYDRLDEFFTYTDLYLASKLEGPVVYIDMSDAQKVW
jgi:hypothetical protein